MPTNLFDNPMSLRQRASKNLGFDASSMIRSQVPQVMQDVEERRQMGRKKYAEDILTQQLMSAKQELENRAAGYHLGQEQQYYSNPATSKMFQDYLGRMGFGSSEGTPINNPHQIKDLMDLQHQALGQEGSKEALAMHLLQTQYPPDPAVIEFAKKNLGLPGAVTTNAPVQGPPAPPPTGQRGALGVFMNRMLPSGAGAGTATMVGKKVFQNAPGGLWGKIPLSLVAASATGLMGENLAHSAMGELTPEELAMHPTAANMGTWAGILSGLAGGNRLSSPALIGNVGNKGVASLVSRIFGKKPLAPGQIRVKPGYQPVPAPPAPGVGTVNTPPIPNLPPSMGNVPGYPSQAPGVTDPAMQRFLQSLYKRTPTPQATPSPP